MAGTGTNAAPCRFVTTRRDRILVAIAIFRLAKALALVLIGAGALRLLHPGVADALCAWLDSLPFVTGHPAAGRAMASVTRLSHVRMREVAAGAFAYAALFATEGIGLLCRRRWAEWLTIIVTTSFIPFEIVGVVHRITATRVTMVILNAAIVVYLVWRRIRSRGCV